MEVVDIIEESFGERNKYHPVLAVVRIAHAFFYGDD
jgi:hypothetical protein